MVGPPPPERLPLSSRIALLRLYVADFGSFEEAAEALNVRPNTLRRNINRETATHEALDVIAESLPPDFSI